MEALSKNGAGLTSPLPKCEDETGKSEKLADLMNFVPVLSGKYHVKCGERFQCLCQPQQGYGACGKAIPAEVLSR